MSKMSKLLLLIAVVSFVFNPSPSRVTNADAVEPPIDKIAYVSEVWVTAYSSTPEETDDTPFITASGKGVRDGIVAANFLPIGTRVKIPAVFGDKIFTVEDRMHPRKKNVMDVWMPSKGEALKFGAYYTEIAVLEQ